MNFDRAWWAMICWVALVIAGGEAWAQVFEVEFELEPKSAQNDSRFGHAVAISGDTILVGRPRDSSEHPSGGSAYVFSARTGEILHKLTPPVEMLSRLDFGSSVAIEGDLGIVGCSLDFDGVQLSGSLFVFELSTGKYLRTIFREDGRSFDQVGLACDISNGVVISGAIGADSQVVLNTGAAFLFDVNTGAQLHELRPTDPSEHSLYGSSVAIDGDYAIVGSPAESSFRFNAGAAYVYSVSTGELIRKLIPDDVNLAHRLGSGVDIVGNLAIVASAERPKPDVATVRLFDVTTGEQINRYLVKGQGHEVVHLDVQGDVLSVASHTIRDELAVVCLYDLMSGTLLAEVSRPDPLMDLDEVHIVNAAIDGNTMVFGAHQYQSDAGAAFVVDITRFGLCPADLNRDGFYDFLDISQFIQEQQDWNFDSSFDFLDIQGFVHAFIQGCSIE